MNAIGTRAELRAAVTRGFFEQQQAKLGPSAPRVILPRQIAPMSKRRIATVLSAEIDEPATNAARSAALAGFCHREAHGLLPALLGDKVVEIQPGGAAADRCPCCVARRKSLGADAQALDQMVKHDTAVVFEPNDLLTTVTTTIRVAAAWIDWTAFVDSCDPANWKKLGGEYFRQSDPIPGTVMPRTHGAQGWVGRLHECFDWHWNPDSEAMFDNDLNIDFASGENSEGRYVRCTYDLYRSNASKLWTVRESGGLDVDGGETKATLSRDWFDLTATKQIRFTDPEIGPPGLGAMLNYLAPTLTGLWMHEAVQAGVEKSIRHDPADERREKRRRSERRPPPPTTHQRLS